MKRIVLFIVSVLLIGLLSGCNSTKLSDSFDKDTVEATAKQVIDYWNQGEYDSINAMMQEDLKKVLTSEALSDTVNKTHDKIGSFVEYKTTNVIGQKDKDTDYAVVLIEAKYEKKKALFTISFDTDMKVIGFYMK